MFLPTPIRILLLTAALAPAAFAQNPQPPADAVSVPPAQQNAQPATITYTGGRITVAAENASLNQILHAISQQTGMKITGGVVDERVYGNYGPATPAAILAQLLNGTTSNMLLVQTSAAVPMELILTPRNGGPTPPSPNSGSSSSYSPRGDGRAPIGSRFIVDRPPPQQPAGATVPAPNPNTPQSSTTQPSATTQQSPNGVKTPQEIFNDIQEQRRQQLQNGEITE